LSSVKWVQGGPVEISLGSVFVVELWATWCPPCRDAIPHLSELANKYKNRATFSGITDENDVNKIQQFVSKMGPKLIYNVGIDSSVTSGLMRTYKVQGIPHAFIVSSKGTVAWHGHPMDPQFEHNLEKCVNEASTPAATKTWTREQLQDLSVKDLKAIIADKQLSYEGLVEKSELIDKILGSKL